MRRAGDPILLTVFLISGASGLIYQVVWSRAMTLIFGSTTQGVATVLAGFMAGLALGSWIASRFGDRIRRPLRAYAWIECGIALLSLSILFLMPALDATYRALYPIVHLSLPALTTVRFLLASAFLLPATTLMGATLPVLSAYAERRGGSEGEGASTLYAVNTAGAVAGTAGAGFLLLPALGMTGTTWLAAAGNLIAAAAALHLSRLPGSATAPATSDITAAGGAPDGAAADRSLPASARAGVAFAIAASGAGALILEVVWTRTLSLVLGSSTQAFTVMLTTFLVGLTIGSAIASRLLRRLSDPVGAFAIAELLVGLTVYAGVYLFPELPYSFLVLFRHTHGASLAFEAGRFALAGAIMLAPTLLLGTTFPLAVRAFRLGAAESARPVGVLYAMNTLGAIAGSLAAGFLLVPALGLQQTLIAGGLVNLAVGIVLLAISPAPRRTRRFALAGSMLLLMPGLVLGAPRWDLLLMTSGVFQYAPSYSEQFKSREEFAAFHAQHKELYYKDGATTTVTVEKRPARADGRVWLALTVNGKVDASSVGDMETQILAGQIPMLLSPSPKRVLAIGWGSGITVGSILTHPGVSELRAVEIEPAVIEASRFFSDFNNDPWDDPRLQIEINDARHALLVDDSVYDIIVSEPSNPWLSGPARLFTREFFHLAKARLAPGGLLCQWVQLYGLSTDSYLTLVRTLREVFSDVVILKGAFGDTLVVASSEPIRFDVARIRERLRQPEVARDLARIKISSAASLLSRYRAGGGMLKEMAGDGPLNTDDNALIEFAAARSLYTTTDTENDTLLRTAPSSPLDQIDLSGVGPVDAARFPAALARELMEARQPERAMAALERAGDPRTLPAPAAADLEAAWGDWLARQEKFEEARRRWSAALAIDPRCVNALLSLGRNLDEEAHEPAQAAAYLRRALEEEPRSTAAALALGRALRNAGSAKEAIAVLSAAAETEPVPALVPALHLQWGRACQAAGDGECAIRELTRYYREWREIPKPAQESQQGAFDLAMAYLARDERALALEQFRIAADLGASLASWQRDEADAARARGDLKAVESHLREAIRWSSRDITSYRSLGDLLMRQGRWDEAFGVWRDLTVREPDDRLALGGAVEALKRAGRWKEAAPFVKRLMDLEEDPGRITQLREALRDALATR